MSKSKGTKGGTLCNTRRVPVPDVSDKKNEQKESRAFVFTWNNYSKDDIETLKAWFQCRSNLEYVFQEEVGEEKGTPHLQGCFKSKSSIKWSTVNSKFPKMQLKDCKSWEASKKYCSKLDTRAGETFTNIKELIPPKNPLGNNKPREWQQNIINMVKKEPDDRTIVWIYDELGNSGKTKLCKYLTRTMKNNVLGINGKASDMKYGVSQFIDNKNNDLKIVLINFVRSQEQFISYQGIEEVKDGYFYNTKYECKMVDYDEVHVIIFANFKPDTTQLSRDRWEIYEIINNKLVDITNQEIE